MSQKQLMSSRLQGLKFMQRGAQRAAAATSTHAPKGAATQSTTVIPQEEAEPTEDMGDAEHWVVPLRHRPSVASPTSDTNDWGAWFSEATEQSHGRKKYGSWGNCRRGHDSDDDDDDEKDPDLSEDSEDDTLPRSAAMPKRVKSSARPKSSNRPPSDSEEDYVSARDSPEPEPQTFRKPPSTKSGPPSKRRGSPSIKGPPSKFAIVADRSQGLRKKKQR